MKKLTLAMFLMSIILLFIGCKKMNGELSDADSLQTNIDTISVALADSSLQTTSDSLTVESEFTEDVKNKKIFDRLTSRASIATSSGDPIVSLADISSSEDLLSSDKMGSVSRERGSSARRGMRLSKSYSSDNLGLSVGGAKDIGNFRENIKNHYMPIVEDITHEGIFYDYYFDNNLNKEASHLFEPTYTSYKNKHPITNEEELYLSVGLNSNLKASSFKRKNLNLVIVLDISGSMTERFDKYHYDGKKDDNYQETWDNRSKIEIAKDCIIALTKQLDKDDRLAVVLFNNQSHLAKPFNLVGKTNMDQIRSHIKKIEANGSTNMYEGIATASNLFNKLPEYSNKEYDNRIIFLTDAMPNTNITDKKSIWWKIKDNAEQKVYSTFIGVGIDLNNELINYISKTPGANYYSVHSGQDFKKRMNTQFDYMVTPLVFDLTLHLKSDNYEIERIFGAPEANQATGEIMEINTLFPSESKDGKTRGGIILIKLKKIGNDSDLELRCSYKDRNGIPDFVSEKINFSKELKGSNNGIRKAVLLSRYVDLMHNWIENKTIVIKGLEQDDWLYGKEVETIPDSDNWERRSTNLRVSSYYKEVFKRFKNHFSTELKDIKDEDLEQEIELLDFLIAYNNKSIPHNDNNQVNSQTKKEVIVREWFANALLPRINQEYDRYKLRKNIRGKLVFWLYFKDDTLIKAKIRGRGSVADKTFIANLQKIIEQRQIPGIGNYQITLEQNFE